MAKHKKKITSHILPFTLTFILLTLSFFVYQEFIFDKYPPFVFIGDTNVSFLSKGEAIRKFQSKFDARIKQKLNFIFAQGSYELDLATSSASIDYSIFDLSFNNSKKKQIQTILFTNKFSPKITLSLDNQMDEAAKQVDKPYQDAKLIFNETTTAEGSPSAEIQTQEAVNGLALNKDKLKEEVSNFILTGKYKNGLPIQTVLPKITTGHIIKAKQALEQTINNPIKLTFQNSFWILDTKQILTLLDLTSGQNLLLDKDKTNTYLKNIANQIDQEVAEGFFEFNPDTKKVSSFKPSREGRKLDIDKTYQILTDSLTSGINSIDLPVDIVKPKIQTSDVNSLGIEELLGRGISNFAGSIQNRIYNVGLTAQKINGVLVPPGEIFSFNQTVGDITAATGFKQAYVIKEGRTVLDDGGGVCQDSTTLFRAVLNAGLPVVKRTAHAYRVGYYEQGFPPGLDATVYYPSVDFQFKNDTKAHILIQAYTYGSTLYVDLYGTSDGRVATISKSIITDQTPPPTELRQDDPTLPKGTVKQVDWAAWGAKVSFSRIVTRNGEQILKETWNSSYKPWQAVYLAGTKEN